MKKIKAMFLGVCIVILCSMEIDVSKAVISAHKYDRSSGASQKVSIYDNAAGSFKHVELKVNENSTGRNILLVDSQMENNCRAALIQNTIEQGLANAYDQIPVSQAAETDFTNYSIVIFVYDKDTETYSKLEKIRFKLEDYASSGGIVICEAAYHTPYGSADAYGTLPGGVFYITFEDHYYKIKNTDNKHPVLTGELTKDGPLTSEMLCKYVTSNYNILKPDTIPDGSDIILENDFGDALFVDSPYGKGRIIYSGIQWAGFDLARPVIQYALKCAMDEQGSR